jgi:hypothetical protein
MKDKKILDYIMCFIILIANIMYWAWWCYKEILFTSNESLGTFGVGFVLTCICFYFIYDKTEY